MHAERFFDERRDQRGIVAVGVVGGYGFLVWMYQIVYGPPGPPGG